ncbi:MAG: ABC transporter permease subunit [Flavobacteriales bacterium]|nr:ABC transporter permease subunit [Flavobacteriales bacterium]
MNLLRSLFEPFAKLPKSAVWGLLAAEALVALLAWQLSGDGLIPGPLKVGASLVKVLGSAAFMENFLASLFLTFKGMGISILIALVISYLSIVPVFKPLADLVVRLRYLTLTGLILLFMLLTQNGGQLKISLLMFGIIPFFVTSLLAIIGDIDRQEVELCRTLRMGSWRTLWEIVIVGRLDQVFEVMRQNFAIAWMMITMVEGLSMSEGGLGTMLIKSNKYMDISTVFALLIVIFLVGLFFDWLLGRLRAWLFPYTRVQLAK